MDGRFPRLTSTYTEDLGHVSRAERPQVATHTSGLLPWGMTQRETEYLKAYSGELMRHPQFNAAKDAGDGKLSGHVCVRRAALEFRVFNYGFALG
jgi:hypothetical protein